MPSRKHRTTLKSGNSRRSTTRETPRRQKSSSPTATASFEQVFGKILSPELERLIASKSKAQANLAEIELTPVPKERLFALRRSQRLWRVKRQIELLNEAIESLSSN